MNINRYKYIIVFALLGVSIAVAWIDYNHCKKCNVITDWSYHYDEDNHNNNKTCEDYTDPGCKCTGCGKIGSSCTCSTCTTCGKKPCSCNYCNKCGNNPCGCSGEGND